MFQVASKELYSVRSINPYWKSTLFHEIYLEQDIPIKYKEMWSIDESGDYHAFLEGLRDLSVRILKKDNPEHWIERDTRNNLISKVLVLLGWTAESQTDLPSWAEDMSLTYKSQRYEPDYIITNDIEDLSYIREKDGLEKLNRARHYSIMPVEAKSWGVLTNSNKNKNIINNRDKKEEDRFVYANVEDQILKYMEVLNTKYGVLTDGKTWRLYNLDSSQENKKYYQFNFGYFLKNALASIHDKSDWAEVVEQGKYFYYFFSKKALYSANKKETFIDNILKYSQEYTNEVEENMKSRFLKAMGFACNGFYKDLKNKKENLCDKKITLLRNVSESHLFNILFIKYCESREILPLKKEPMYWEKSLTKIIDKLNNYMPDWSMDKKRSYLKKRFSTKDFDYQEESFDLYNNLLNLTSFIQKGVNSKYNNFQITGFNESLFSEKEYKFAQVYKIPNQFMIEILFSLGYSEVNSKDKYIDSKDFKKIPYNIFTPRQLGSIYEYFLEFKVDQADSDMIFKNKIWSKKNLAREELKTFKGPKVRKGELFFTPDNEKRKVTGSYYTEDCVVQYILKETLFEKLNNKTPEEIESLKVCDPAMGSGHFLCGALNYISSHYIASLKRKQDVDVLDRSITSIKKHLLHQCIYGVDLNPRAVKLAKMSLWLETAEAGRPLEHLNDQLRTANSLTDVDLWEKQWKFIKKSPSMDKQYNGNIDVIIGNPPYLGEKGHKDIFHKIKSGWLGNFYLGKMDLFYFFFHLGINLLKDDGKLGFITTNYYPTALGAKKLREDFYNRTFIETLLNLNQLKAFKDAQGQHNMVTILKKREGDFTTQVINTKETGNCNFKILQEIVTEQNDRSSIFQIDKNDLFDGDDYYIRHNMLNLNVINMQKNDSILLKILSGNEILSDYFDVNQGIVSGADKVSEKHISKFNIKAKKGDGIFVVSKDELRKLNLTIEERKTIVKLFYKNSDIEKFNTLNTIKDYIIYLDKRLFNFKHLNNNLKSHFIKFKEIIENSVCNPPYLHRPRKQSMFEGPKIVCPQRSKLNTFGYNECEWYASADVYYITMKNSKSNIELKYLLGLLNSKLYFMWLYMRGKRKGETLELYQKPLSEIPIKVFSKQAQRKIIILVDKLISNPNNIKAWNKLNEEIYKLYSLTKQEIKIVEDLYNKQSTEKIAA